MEWQNLLFCLNKTLDKTITGVYCQMTLRKTPASERVKDRDQNRVRISEVSLAPV